MDLEAQKEIVPPAPTEKADLLRLARHSSDLNVNFDVLPPLLPSHVATFVTRFAASTRVSLRVAVYLIETFLETTQFSTRVSLTYTRRFLISALSFAKDAHNYPINHHLVLPESTDTFLLALDKYTSMGIHMVQHTFSLVELFTMAGFYLTASAVQSAHHAAQESVSLLDGLFGSTQSSRALAAIIEMVGRELDMEDRVKGKKGKKTGMLGGLGTLTKAITAFACLQNATWERTRGKQRMVQVYNFLVRPETQPLLGLGGKEASPAARYLEDPTPETAAMIALHPAMKEVIAGVAPAQAAVLPPQRPKRKRHQTEMPNTASSSRYHSSSHYHPIHSFESPPIARSPSRNDRYVRSRSLDLTREMAAGLGMSHDETSRQAREASDPPQASAPWNPMSMVAPSEPSTGLSMDSLGQGTSSPHNSSRPRFTSPPYPPEQLSQHSRTSTDTNTDSDPMPEAPPSSTAGVLGDSGSSDYAMSKTEGSFPRRHLLHNLHRFMKYSAAAYGQMFLRVFGTGTSDYSFPSTAQHHSNSWAFAQYTGIPIDCLLLTSYVDASPMFDGHKAPPLVHFVAVDHAAEAIVLTCRGTLGLSDILVDLTCGYRTISVDHADPSGEYYVHEGMHEAALGLCLQGSRVHRTLADALNQYPSYGLIICGHSLGGGVAALLALLTAIPTSSYSFASPSSASVGAFVTAPGSGLPPGRPIHCYAYGPPAIMSPDLARYAEGLVTSIVQDCDIVPSLSLGTLRDLKNIAVTMSEEKGLAEELFSRVVGMHKNPLYGDVRPPDAESLADWLVALVSTLRADMHNDKLYPPGEVYVMEVNEVLSTVGNVVLPGKDNAAYRSHRAILRRCTSVEERFREPIFARTMLNDHLPSNYERSTYLLLRGMMQEGEGSV